MAGECFLFADPADRLIQQLQIVHVDSAVTVDIGGFPEVCGGQAA